MQEADLGTDHPLAPLLFQRLVAADQLDDEAAAVATALGESAGARAAKAATRDLLLPTLRSQCDREIEGLAAAAADTVIARRLSMLYKMNR